MMSSDTSSGEDSPNLLEKEAEDVVQNLLPTIYSMKPQQRTRVGSRQHSSGLPRSVSLVPLADYTPSAPQLGAIGKNQREAYSASEANLPLSHQNEPQTVVIHSSSPATNYSSAAISSGDMNRATSPLDLGPSRPSAAAVCRRRRASTAAGECCKTESTTKGVNNVNVKNCRSCSPINSDDSLTRQIKDISLDTRKSARVIKDSKARLLELQKKSHLSEADVRELSERHELLLREMDRFDRVTKNIQKLVGSELHTLKKSNAQGQHIPGSIYEPLMYHEMMMNHPTVLLASSGRASQPPDLVEPTTVRSKSEIDLTRKLTESYDMQEKLVADNADLEVKRYILYKELMTKDQNLETCRAQVKRLQGELKLMSKENAMLNERLSKSNPEGDAPSLSLKCTEPNLTENNKQQTNSADPENAKELLLRLENYKSTTAQFETQLEKLESEVKHIRGEMNVNNDIKAAAYKVASDNARTPSCKAGGEKNLCYTQPPHGPPVPPLSRACGICPPCPAPCNPGAAPTPAEREVARLTIQLRQTEENFKTKVCECAVLRAELLKKKEELEKERCQHRECQNKLRELEMKFEGLATHTNMMLGTKEQAFEQEVNVRALKQCYKEARDEIDELRTLLKEQNDQLQDYRVKYLQAQQLVEEQRRQMDLMDMDNTRISEQINLEIQRVKLKFQEKLQELAPIPELLKATQIRLKDAQQAQALAEHNAEQMARELNVAREKVHTMLHNSVKPPEKVPERSGDEKQITFLQARVTQLSENNAALKQEIERLKSNVIKLEEQVLINEKRLQEKMHECAQLGGELDRTRDEAARALQRANERLDTIRKCMQTTIAELERQLAAARATIRNSEKERQELQMRMQCQIKRLNENFEQAQLRIMGLTTQVQTLRRTVSSTGEGEGDIEDATCVCKTVFDNV